MFAVLRAIVVAGTIALAFGLNLSHGYWMPIAAIVSMKASLDQTTLVAVQRLAGALFGAVAAALLLLIPTSEHGLRLVTIDLGLQVVALVIVTNGVAIRFWNYALYCGAIAAGVLILIDLPQPSDYAAEGYRVLWTLCGVGIGDAGSGADHPAEPDHRGDGQQNAGDLVFGRARRQRLAAAPFQAHLRRPDRRQHPDPHQRRGPGLQDPDTRPIQHEPGLIADEFLIDDRQPSQYLLVSHRLAHRSALSARAHCIPPGRASLPLSSGREGGLGITLIWVCPG
jgi:hypothetical protein